MNMLLGSFSMLLGLVIWLFSPMELHTQAFLLALVLISIGGVVVGHALVTGSDE